VRLSDGWMLWMLKILPHIRAFAQSKLWKTYSPILVLKSESLIYRQDFRLEREIE
jgi:hypothetical protein